MSLRRLLKHRCSIQRASTTASRGVQVKSSWPDVETNLRCLLQEKKGRIQSGQQGEFFEYDAVCYIKPTSDLDIRPNANNDLADRLKITKHPIAAIVDSVFEVVHANDTSGQGELLNVYLKRRSAGE